ncbi:VWA domain-containing protein [Paraglaciecola aquimarina]|uniref:VWA domain-containing protein n=1 Tax=Paraglaciecola algarum TaxID=3050085 RepID=A0ABS9DBZ4_9ALTE|nr:VWA domain-containing protein [Paraglaciecola sp. G1-23]MCF2950361.1 VWA domain-containing protein [Paraglaciecola sp. G1-23]
MIDQLSLMNEFHFIRPHWLWAIIPLLIIVGLTRHIQKQQSGWQSVLASHLYQHLMTSDGAKQTRPPLFLLALAWVIATLALAGPTWERLPQPVYQLNTGKVVLIDMSLSMRATDVTPNRLTRAKYKAIDLVNAITEGETGLVAYAGDAFTISPLSSDAQNLTTLIPSLTPEIMPIAGSDPALGLQAAIELLQNAGYQQGEIFWITDGVENQQMKEVSEILNGSLFRLSILAVGTEEGAPIQQTNGELLKDSRGAIVIPKLTTSNLSSLASSGGGRYAPMQTDDSDIDYLLDQSLLEEEQDEESKEENEKDSFGDKWQEMGPYLLLLLLPIAAYAFRRGIITVLLAAVLLPVYTPQAQADWWQDMWQTSDQQAMKSYKSTDFEKAAGQFDDPMWQGNAHYKNKNYEEALKSYSQAAKADANNIDALYNMGNTLAQMQELDKAIAAYDQVLAQQPEHQDALTNKALLEKLKQQQEQQNQDQQDQSDGEDGEQSEQDQQQGDQQQDGENQQGDQQEQQEQQEQQDGQDSQSQQEQDQQDSEQNSEQNEQQGSQGEENEQQGSEGEESEQAQQQAEEENEEQSEEQQAQAAQAQETELTDEQKEQMQRMQTLLNRVPDDPAFLLKRKMQIEAQRRKRERLPTNIQGNW